MADKYGSNTIGASKPVVGGSSMALNNQKGQGGHNPLASGGNANPGGTKPMRPADPPIKLNATSAK